MTSNTHLTDAEVAEYARVAARPKRLRDHLTTCNSCSERLAAFGEQEDALLGAFYVVESQAGAADTTDDAAQVDALTEELMATLRASGVIRASAPTDVATSRDEAAIQVLPRSDVSGVRHRGWLYAIGGLGVLAAAVTLLMVPWRSKTAQLASNSTPAGTGSVDTLRRASVPPPPAQPIASSGETASTKTRGRADHLAVVEAERAEGPETGGVLTRGLSAKRTESNIRALVATYDDGLNARDTVVVRMPLEGLSVEALAQLLRGLLPTTTEKIALSLKPNSVRVLGDGRAEAAVTAIASASDSTGAEHRVLRDLGFTFRRTNRGWALAAVRAR